MNKDNEKNISLVLKSDSKDDESKIVVSFSTIFRQIRRVLSIWIVLAIVAGLVTVSGTMILNKTVQSDIVTSLVCFSYPGAEEGLDPNGDEFDVNKIKAPSVIESALTTLDLPLSYVEPIRRNIHVKGIIPSDAMEQINLYYKVYSQGGSAGYAAVKSLLEIEYSPTYYVINFNNNAAGFDIKTGKKIVDEVLNSYQDYFFTLYGYNEALGNSIAAVDYKEYDYPAAVDIFKGIYDDLDTYIRNLQAEEDSENFRSNDTGYSFEDIRRSVEVLRNTDLDSLSAYITINNVTKDVEQLITYYEYRIEELKRENNVLTAELNSLSKSISDYEKDELLIFGETSEFDEQNYSQVSEKYDEMIENKVAVQEEQATKMQDIKYFESRLKTFKGNKEASSGDIEYVEKRFEKLYEKTKEIIDITTDTSDEYYENVVFANAFNILVPSSGEESTVEMGNIVMPVLIAEAVVFVAVFVCAFVSAFVIDSKKRKNAKEENIEENKIDE